MRRHKFYGEWAECFREHLMRLGDKGVTQQEFAEKTKITVQMVNSYFTGRSKPSLARAPAMADALGLHGKERERFLWLAYEHYTPEPVWREVRSLSRTHEQTLAELDQARTKRAELEEQLAATRAEIASIREQRAALDREVAEIRAEFLRVMKAVGRSDSEVTEHRR